MVLKKLRNHGKIHFIYGQGVRKVKGFFSHLGAFCGSEGVKKPETERCLMQIGEASLFRCFWELEGFLTSTRNVPWNFLFI